MTCSRLARALGVTCSRLVDYGRIRRDSEDTKAVLRGAQTRESNESARKTLTIVLKSADAVQPNAFLM